MRHSFAKTMAGIRAATRKENQAAIRRAPATRTRAGSSGAAKRENIGNPSSASGSGSTTGVSRAENRTAGAHAPIRLASPLYEASPNRGKSAAETAAGRPSPTKTAHENRKIVASREIDPICAICARGSNVAGFWGTRRRAETGHTPTEARNHAAAGASRCGRANGPARRQKTDARARVSEKKDF